MEEVVVVINVGIRTTTLRNDDELNFVLVLKDFRLSSTAKVGFQNWSNIRF